jgi:uncharacterized sulfatase
MDRRDFLKKCAAAGTAGTLFSNKSMFMELTRTERLNILWLIAEDFSPHLGCYGTPLVKTPNIDQLAKDGALFTNAFTSAPVCSASRSGFMTGMYQTSIGAHHHRSHRGDGYKPPEPAKVITEYFRDAGYYTCNAKGTDFTKSGKTDFNFNWSNPFDGTDWRDRQPDQPFFAQVNFSQTHRSFSNDTINPVDPALVELPPYYPDHPITRRDWADYLEDTQLLDTNVGLTLQRLEDDGLAENTIVFFFGDHGQAHVRGKQFVYDSGIHVPLIIRWPDKLKPGSVIDDLVSAIDFAPACYQAVGIPVPSHMEGRPFLGPGADKRAYIFAARDRCDGTYDRTRCIRSKRYKYIRNYFPNQPYTALYGDYYMPGPYTAFNSYKWKQYPVLTVLWALHNAGQLTADQENFMTAARPMEELYDIQTDPHELNNLAGQPQYLSLQNSLSAELDNWITQTGDHGQQLEDVSVTQEQMDKMENSHANNMISRGFTANVTPEDYLQYWLDQFGL